MAGTTSGNSAAASLQSAIWWLQAAMYEQAAMYGSTVTVYKGDTQKELGRFDAGITEAALWQELVTPSAKGRLLRSDGIWVTQGSTAVAQGNYQFHADKAASGQGQGRGGMRGGPIRSVIGAIVNKVKK